VDIQGGSGTITGCTFSGDDPGGAAAERAVNLHGGFVFTGNRLGGGYLGPMAKTFFNSEVVVGLNSGGL
jgi:hypothetical protein